eukprot:127634_1
MGEQRLHQFELPIKTEKIGRTISVAFKCELCNEEFSFKEQLVQHVTASHKLPIDTVKSEAGNASYTKSQSSITRENRTIEQMNQQSDLHNESFTNEDDWTRANLRSLTT